MLDAERESVEVTEAGEAASRSRSVRTLLGTGTPIVPAKTIEMIEMRKMRAGPARAMAHGQPRDSRCRAGFV